MVFCCRNDFTLSFFTHLIKSQSQQFKSTDSNELSIKTVSQQLERQEIKQFDSATEMYYYYTHYILSDFHTASP